MPGMVDYKYDAEGDVKMTVPQQIFEMVTALSLRCGVKLISLRSSVSVGVPDTEARSFRTSLKPRVLEHVAHYILKRELESVTDAMLLAEMKRKVGGMVNDRVPDVARLFTELKMNLEEVDVEARIAKYFMDFDCLVEDNALTGMLGRGPAIGEPTANEDELLLEHVTPEILKVDMTRMVDLTHRQAKTDDLVLHDLMIERATRQQQYYSIQREMKQNVTLRSKEEGSAANKSQSRPSKQLLNSVSTKESGQGAASAHKPSRDGCLVCKGPHWVRDCPTATAEQKANVEKLMKEKWNRPQGVKRVTTEGKREFRNAIVNGVMEVPFCPDTGSDVNITGRPVMAELRDLVTSYSHVFRVNLGRDGAADVQPLEFLWEYVRELEEADLIQRNTQRRWACRALPVAKRGTDEFRITIDYRPVNRLTVPLAGASPNLAVVTESRIVFTPTRLPQGASDSAVHVQAQMNEVLRDLCFRSVLVWINDVFLFARTASGYLENLTKLFGILRQRKLKLNARKCKRFAKRVNRCGKLIDGEGVEHDPERLAALQRMPLPPTGAALQHFLCALNWLRDSMVDYSRITSHLHGACDAVSWAKDQLSGAILEWSAVETEAFRETLRMVERSSKLAFPDKGATVCMFSDASLTGYALVLTQVLNWQDGVPVEEQQHELLICGLFKTAQKNRLIVEKEGYPIVKACGDLDYMLVREKGFHIFLRLTEVKQHIKGKLQLWAVKLVGCRYVIQHIAGEPNLWADIISRWGQPAIPDASEPLAVRRMTTRYAQTLLELRPLQSDQFAWPTRAEIIRVQQQYHGDAPDSVVVTDDGIEVGGKLWLPSEAKQLLKRLFVVAHCGIQGHRGVNVMVELLGRRFVLLNTRKMVTRFVNQCLLCKHVKGGQVIQRNWTVDRPVAKRNECQHLDYLYLGDSYGDTMYVLVLKDELTHYCEFVPADAVDSQTAVVAILEWNKRFGAPPSWMSYNGSHFKNEMMGLLAERLGASHQFAPVYTPWINGTVERVNRDILQVLRVMLLESLLDTRYWVHLLPIIQANLNHTPVFSLGNCSPVELFTGLSAASSLDIVAAPTERVLRNLPMEKAELREAVETLRQSLHGMRRVVRDRCEQQRVAAMARSKGTVCNFNEGDYVLWSRVDKRLQGNKLLVPWVGPFQVVEALPHAFLIRHLLTGAEYDAHVSRLKYYYDADLDVTAGIREHVSLQGIVLEVRGVVSHRFNTASGELELLVVWRGLQDVENSWELAHSIKHDVPALVAQYAADHNMEELQ
ncbi:LOW QUALITY PROTEIN: hypothetical protein PHMEG_00012264 [Phytophthora megakarya]|uniref:Integrase catalytic domain-containing protein n=1 Tax=Phytophthora megakarya TaxID=4795 RepID=A0A225W9M2_9STRA|nr:LOW QUALITY PROTEIN: hypothetical protein PHMEG_00012264 [Phytophthora megakarya]